LVLLLISTKALSIRFVVRILRPVNYYQDHEIVHISELDFHRPFVLHQQDSLETQRSLSKIFFIENREMPILHKPWAFGETFHQRSWKVFVCRYLPTNKIALLCVLCDSAVNAYNFMLFSVTLCPSDEEPLSPPNLPYSMLDSFKQWFYFNREISHLIGNPR
jgi:hypothetical protein